MSNIKNIAFLSVLVLGLFACGEKKVEETPVVETPVETPAAPTGVDLTASTIMWEGSKPAGKHNGTISISAGELTYDANGDISGGNFTLDMNSITVTDLQPGDGKEDLEAHLKGSTEKDQDDFFNVAKYPTGTFAITSITPITGSTDGSTHAVKGNLTLKDVTKEVSFNAMVKSNDTKTEFKIETPEFMINRTQWNINYGSKTIFNNLKDKFINDDIKLKLVVVARK